MAWGGLKRFIEDVDSYAEDFLRSDLLDNAGKLGLNILDTNKPIYSVMDVAGMSKGVSQIKNVAYGIGGAFRYRQNEIRQALADKAGKDFEDVSVGMAESLFRHRNGDLAPARIAGAAAVPIAGAYALFSD